MNKQRGFSLVEVIIAGAIMSVIGLGIAQMVGAQAKQGRAMGERIAALASENLMNGILANGAICTYQVNNPAVRTFNTTSASNAVFNFTYLATGPTATAPHAFQVGTTIPNSTSVAPSSIQLKNFSGSGGSWTADWVVSFDNSRTILPIDPIVSRVALQVDASIPTAARITGCNTTGRGGIDLSPLGAAGTSNRHMYINGSNVAIQFTTDPTVKAVWLGVSRDGSTGGSDTNLTVLTPTGGFLYFVFGHVHNGDLRDAGATILVPLDTNGKGHFANTFGATTNAMNPIYSILSYVR